MKKGLQKLFAKGLMTLLCAIVPFVASFAQGEAQECANIAAFKAIEGESVPVTFTDTLTVVFSLGYDGVVLYDETGYLLAEGSICYEDLESGALIANMTAVANYYGMYACYVQDFEVLEETVAVEYKTTTISELKSKGIAEYEYIPVKLEKVEILNKIDTLHDQEIGSSTSPEDYSSTPILGDKIVLTKYLVNGEDTLLIGGQDNFPNASSCTVKGFLSEVEMGYDEVTSEPIMAVAFNITETEGLETVLYTNLPITKGYDTENYSAYYFFNNGEKDIRFEVEYGTVEDGEEADADGEGDF